MGFDTYSIIGLVLVSFCIVTAALIAVTHLSGEVKSGDAGEFDPHNFEPAVYLFDNELLIDATDRARTLISVGESSQSPWRQLMSFLSAGFKDIEGTLKRLPRGEKFEAWSAPQGSAPMRLIGEWRNGMLRITVIETENAEASIIVDAESIFALERDAQLLRAICEHSPILVWKTAGDSGEINWANKLYLELVESVSGQVGVSWPPPRVLARQISDSNSNSPRRASVRRAGEEGLSWFNVEAYNLSNETLNFAIPADSEVRTEGALKEFIQTLAKTFAHLPVGLAIFNKSRHLILFNPALTDLTALPVTFMSAKPSLTAFLDELRNRRVMPEPKNYKAWRKKIMSIEAEAAQGTFEEMWSLPDGITYKVTGRPHPEGAFALLFEDVSSEVALTRRFRSDMEVGQSMMDNVPEALATFSPNGVLTRSNEAYGKMWGVDPRTTLGQISIADAMRDWRAACEPTQLWEGVPNFIGDGSERVAWEGSATQRQGGALRCRFVPLSGGETMIGFSNEQDHLAQEIQGSISAENQLAD